MDDLGKDNKKRKGKKVHKFDIKISFRNRGGWLKYNWYTTVCCYGELENLDQWPSLGLMGGREKQRGEG